MQPTFDTSSTTYSGEMTLFSKELAYEDQLLLQT